MAIIGVVPVDLSEVVYCPADQRTSGVGDDGSHHIKVPGTKVVLLSSCMW